MKLTADGRWEHAVGIWRDHSECNIGTGYTLNEAGEIEAVNYTDSTPGVSYGIDRLGRQTNIESRWGRSATNEITT